MVATNSTSVFGIHIAAPSGGATSFDLFVLYNAIYGAICVEDPPVCATCSGSCGTFRVDKSTELATKTFLRSSNQYKYETVMDHVCGQAMKMSLNGQMEEKVSYNCQWDGSWKPVQTPVCQCEFDYLLPARVSIKFKFLIRLCVPRGPASHRREQHGDNLR